jgi:hypothetical protein
MWKMTIDGRIDKKTETPLAARSEVGLDVKAEKTKYVAITRIIKTATENMVKFKLL